ncbi:MAG: NTP transferase domain-containing protein [Patescibacteria group bacterium]
MEKELSRTKILILAAGKGKRMESDIPKVLTILKGRPMIRHVLESIHGITSSKPVAIVGHKAELVKQELGDAVVYAYQKEQLGTGHAVASAKEHADDAEHVLILAGDQPFISSQTIKNLIKTHTDRKAKVTFTTTIVENFEGWKKGFMNFGRILRDGNTILGIKEYKDANTNEKSIKEVNITTYIFNGPWLWENLSKLKNENAQNEYYLTDLIHLATEQNEIIATITIDNKEAIGINTKEELEIVEQVS